MGRAVNGNSDVDEVENPVVIYSLTILLSCILLGGAVDGLVMYGCSGKSTPIVELYRWWNKGSGSSCVGCVSTDGLCCRLNIAVMHNIGYL